MRNRKGQGVIIEILAFAMSIMLTVVIFVVMISTGNTMEHNVNKDIGYELSELRKRSVISITMNDHLWRSNQINKGKYANWQAYQVLSYYFSTPGDKISVYDDEIDKEEVKKDLKHYIRYKMDKYWKEGPNDVDYYFNISNSMNKGPRNITVKSYTDVSGGNEGRITYPISLTNGKSAEVTLWTTGSAGIYSVGGSN